MESQRVRIVDIAEELGVSTATVSNVIHGKTKKISDETVKRVQELLEKRQYIPSMAGILLAQNDSKIIGVVINDHEKYEGHPLEDHFIAASLNALTRETEKAGYFLMLKVTESWKEIPRFASMWNMEGMVLSGFCRQDYQSLREQMHIPFVVYDGYFQDKGNLMNIESDHFDGGVQAGEYLKKKGHKRVACISDNDVCMDRERFLGLKSVIPTAKQILIPFDTEERYRFYEAHQEELLYNTAVFAVSDYYAIDLMLFLQKSGIAVPERLSIIGFDDVRECRRTQPPLTTIRQDNQKKAEIALQLLQEQRAGKRGGGNIKLPVTLVERGSVQDLLS